MYTNVPSCPQSDVLTFINGWESNDGLLMITGMVGTFIKRNIKPRLLIGQPTSI